MTESVIETPDLLRRRNRSLGNCDSDELLLQEMWAAQIKRIDPRRVAFGVHSWPNYNEKKVHENFDECILQN